MLADSIYGDRTRREVSDAAEKLSNMTVGSGRNGIMRQSLPAPMKAGGWHGHGQSDSFLGRSQELRPGRAAAYSRKVAG